MWYRYYELNSPKKISNYFLWVLLVLWILISLVLSYQFLKEYGQQQEKKWWTLVEATFAEFSYLPYLKNDAQSFFYQSFLFNSCLDYSTLDKNDELESNLCKIITQDYQTYYVSLLGSKKWSDGLDLSIDDLYFSYHDIIHQNKWDLEGLKVYQDIKITLEEDTIKVVFPASNKDNNLFFIHYILPQKVLQNASLLDYQTRFAANPVSSACGKIENKNSDINSLVYNLSQCEGTNLGYYQIKKYEGFEQLSKQAYEKGKNIVDIYSDQVSLDGYRKVEILSNRLLTAFFNTKSDKMSVRLRRALGGLIHANFYQGDYQKFLAKYESELLNKHFSNGTNIEEFINRSALLANQSNTVAAQDLLDSGINPLKNTISINGVERRFVFYLENPEKDFDLTINFSNQFENITVQHEGGKSFSPKNYNKNDKKITYTLKWDENLKLGQNLYTITGKIKGTSYTIAKIDLYGLEKEKDEEALQDDRKIKIIYYNSPESNFTIQQLRKLFEEREILQNFSFEQVSNVEQMEAKLVMGDYDIILNTIDIGMKKDIVKILTTDSATENPSQYSNSNLINLFNQYNKSIDKSLLLEEINAIYAQDMPFVIIGYPYQFINVSTSVFSNEFGSGGVFHDYNWREYVYQNLTLVHNTIIDLKELKDWKSFYHYIKSNLQRSKNYEIPLIIDDSQNLSWADLDALAIEDHGESVSENLEEIDTTANLDE